MHTAHVFLAVLLAAALFLSGCGNGDKPGEGSSGNIELTLVTMQLGPTFVPYFEDLFAEFEKLNPGVKITWLDNPAQDYDTKLMTSFMGASSPDVINLSPMMLPRFVERNMLLDLENHLSAEVLESYFPNVFERACTIQGRPYAVPWYLATAVSMVNMKIMKEVGLTEKDIPVTFEDMLTVARVIKEKSDKFSFFPVYTESGALMGHLMDAGIPIVDEKETRALFNTPEALKVFTFWADFYKDGLAPSEALTAMHRRPIELYKSGKLAIFHSGPQFLRHVKSDSPEVYADTVVFPRLHWSFHEHYPIDAHIMCVSSKTRQPKLAAELAAFITNGPNQLKFCKLATIIPSVKDAAKDPYFSQEDGTLEGRARVLSVESILKGNVIYTPLKHTGKLLRVLDDVTEKVITNRMTPEEGLRQAEEKWNEILKE